ncbi:hypothetical protein H1Z61_03950 [Bacillus aquiflavi]|uniref:Uncharacterized protein n=1 Tax=Bacillus aquiflavi TaxID=2672567 RepID=A0A6B3VUP3_9BACI|nr:hypothetical protein [Bacillus aquiflavi]MBA4536314.1 hypothetical protein [Bacillus aquiflavi]NEY80682.1 hypothetical protein [Bacillus aquiflavi]UAC48849.1 hypothetical protein K6959_02565 [Bacillus aquiflavi]
MAESKKFFAERDKIDYLLQKGYRITGVTENVSGAFVEFTKTDSTKEKETLHIMTADARKYFSSILLNKQKF